MLINDWETLKEKELQYHRKMQDALWKVLCSSNPYTEKSRDAMGERTGRPMWEVQLDINSGVTKKGGKGLKLFV